MRADLRRLRIVIISDWFSEKMGYVENCLPKALASLGHEVHVISSNVQTYFNYPFYKETYEPFIGPGIVSCITKRLNGYTLHRLPFEMCMGHLRIKGLAKALAALRPHIVQTLDIQSLSTYWAALGRPLLGYKLFLETTVLASVFPFATKRDITKRERFGMIAYEALGRFVSLLSERCYAATIDAADIAIRFFGIEPRKVSISSLGVDTDLFRPPATKFSRKVRAQVRSELGFLPSDIVCIYSGRFSQDKDPLCLAKAIKIVRKRNKSFRGLFIGNGPQAGAITKVEGCLVHRFVPFSELLPFYWASDVGVWPRQESTSQLDAVACGLPIVISGRVKAVERVEGNGLTYEEGDPYDLARQLANLSDREIRKALGFHGARKAQDLFSWELAATRLTNDYEASL